MARHSGQVIQTSKHLAMHSLSFTSIKTKPSWSRAEIAGDSCAAEELAITLNSTRPARTYFVCGLLPDDSRYHMYRIETLDPLDIVRDFQVGTHAEISYGVDAHPAVLEQMALVHARNPIVPFLADSAGLKCTFERQVCEDFADFLDATIMEGFEAYEEAGCIGIVVMSEGFLHLWWD